VNTGSGGKSRTLRFERSRKTFGKKTKVAKGGGRESKDLPAIGRLASRYAKDNEGTEANRFSTSLGKKKGAPEM